MMRPGQRIYSLGLGWLLVSGVEAVELSLMGEDDAHADGFASADELHAALAHLFPHNGTDGKQWFRVAFTLQEPAPLRRRAAHLSEAGLFDSCP